MIEGFENWKDKKPRPDGKLIRDAECARCKKWLDCQGKPRGTKCVCFEERLLIK